MTQVLAHPYLNPAAALPLNSAAYEAMMLPLIAARRLRERAVEAALLEIGEKRRAGGSAAIAVAWKDQAKDESAPIPVYRGLSETPVALGDAAEVEQEEELEVAPIASRTTPDEVVACAAGALEMEVEDCDDEGEFFYVPLRITRIVLTV